MCESSHPAGYTARDDFDFLLKASYSDDYGSAIRSNVRALWSGEINGFDFIDRMVRTIDRGFTNAWRLGMAAVGMSLDDRTTEEIDALDQEKYSEFSHIYDFAVFIAKNSKEGGGKLATVFQRASMWSNRFNMVKSMAMVMAGANKKLRWKMNPLKEHCSTCLNLDGRVYRASVWRKYDIYPKHRSLECGGWRCGCVFEVTDDPVTPGRPPSIP